jgi:uncharacterized membrane protein YeaQ/YmgE (transglycosylase-associated protein family)
MSFPAFLILLVVSAIGAAIVRWGFRYRLRDGWDGYVGQWMVAWVGAWLGPAVLGYWGFLASNIHIVPALIGAVAGAFAGTLNARLIAEMAGHRGASS